MELIKYKKHEILPHIRHDLRNLPDGKAFGNESIDSARTKENYSLIDRGSTVKEVNQFRKEFESKLFKFKRRDLVHAIELCVQCPADCPAEQHEAFFQTTFDWYCDNYLPAGKDCVYLCEIHKDEHKFVDTSHGKIDISKDHMHIAFVPAIPAGKKHPDYKYRLNADALTRKSVLKNMHSSLQNTLDKKGIQATVYQKKSGKEKTIPLSVPQLKEITEKTGIVIDKTLTVEKLAEILSNNVELTRTLSDTVSQNQALKEQLAIAQESLQAKAVELQETQEKLNTLEASQKEVSADAWGVDSGWGTSSDWGARPGISHDIEKEINL